MAAKAQEAELRGLVVEFGSRTGLAGVTVELDGAARRVTGDNGQFVFTGIPHGRHRLSFRSIGYDPRDIDIELRNDTSVVVELQVAAVQLDTLVVKPETFTLRGKVRDPVRDINVVYAEILVPGLKPAYTNINGSFKVGKFPGGSPRRVEVRALGYLPEVLSLGLERDTTIDVVVHEDPLARRFVTEVVKKLEVRSRAVHLSRVQFDEHNLRYSRGRSLAEFLKSRTFSLRPACFFVDDAQVLGADPELLESYFIEELHRLEVFGRGRMIRIYTAHYLQKNIASSKQLSRIIYVETPAGPMCM